MRVIPVILSDADNSVFNSRTPIYSHLLAGRMILQYVLDLAHELSPNQPIFVVKPLTQLNYNEMNLSELRILELDDDFTNWNTLSKIIPNADYTNTTILILHANMPLVQLHSLNLLVKKHKHHLNGITFLNEESTNQIEKGTSECHFHRCFVPFLVNLDLMVSVFAPNLKHAHIDKLNLMNLSSFAKEKDISIKTQVPFVASDLQYIHTRVDYASASFIMQSRINKRLMLSGVTMVNPSTAYIDFNVKIGRDTVIHPNTIITGDSVIGENCIIGPNTHIDECKIGDRCRIFASVLESAVMENDTDIGPFSHLRKGAYVCEQTHIGNFGEIKNTTLGPGVRMGHFSYLGDTEVGSETNIGAGTITCNYDGKEKHLTRIGDHAFIGSGTLIVAPIDIGENAKTGAGSVVTHDIPENTLVYGVPARQKGKRDSKD